MKGKTRRCNQGFTLIEMMVVIIIMGFLAAIAVPIALGAIERSRENIDRTKLFYLREALNRALVENEDALFNCAYVTSGKMKSDTLSQKLANPSGIQLFIIEVRPDQPTNVQGKHSSVTANTEMSSLLGKSGTWYDALRESGFNGVADIIAARANGDEWKHEGATFYSVPYNNGKDFRTYPKEPMFISRELNYGKSSGLSGISSQGNNRTNYRLTMSFQWSGGDPNSRSVEVALLPNGAKMRDDASGKGGALFTEHGVCFSTYGPKGCEDYHY